MELHQIEAELASPNPQSRMRAMVALRDHAPEVAVPLLKQRIHDPEFIVRSFVAMGLGNKQTEEGFEILLSLIKTERDANVVAEAANSLEKFGERAIPHLIELFKHNTHWLVRQSIFAALEGVQPKILAQLCRWGWEGEDLVVQCNAIANLEQLQGTPQEGEALAMLLEAAISDADVVRVQVARTLKGFDDPRAKTALSKLRQDPNLRVVGATLESLV